MTNHDKNATGATTRPHRLTRRSFVAGVGAMGALGVLGSFGLTGCAPSGDTAAGGSGAGEGTSESYDAVIIGAGGAGLSAAIAAYDKGLTNIVILEKMAVNGGNTNFSSSGMNASETKFQKEQGIEDSNDLFAQETLDGGHNTGDPELVQFMCDNSAGAIDWLDSLGIKLDNITLTGGMSVKRCHRPTDGSAVGLTLVPGLVAAAEERGIPTKMSCEAKELVKDGDAVTGVKVDLDGKDTTINARAVILATGGLGANAEMVTKYRPDLEGYVTTNQPGATGDGYTMAEDAGAELVQMEQIQIHPTVEQETSTLIAEGVRGGGAILVNSEGNRFFDEMSTRDKVSAAELEQPGGFAWCVFDQQVYDANTRRLRLVRVRPAGVRREQGHREVRQVGPCTEGRQRGRAGRGHRGGCGCASGFHRCVQRHHHRRCSRRVRPHRGLHRLRRGRYVRHQGGSWHPSRDGRREDQREERGA